MCVCFFAWSLRAARLYIIVKQLFSVAYEGIFFLLFHWNNFLSYLTTMKSWWAPLLGYRCVSWIHVIVCGPIVMFDFSHGRSVQLYFITAMLPTTSSAFFPTPPPNWEDLGAGVTGGRKSWRSPSAKAPNTKGCRQINPKFWRIPPIPPKHMFSVKSPPAHPKQVPCSPVARSTGGGGGGTRVLVKIQ